MMENEIKKIVENFGAKLYDTETQRAGDGTIFRVLIMADGGVDLDLCAKISRVLSPYFDTNPPVRGQYFLEVSSPGIERSLTKIEHFVYSIGDKVKLKVTDAGKVEGILKSANNDTIVVETTDVEVSFKLPQIIKAKTYFEWKS
jgi:ribosome maturation factor RimP